MKNLRFLGLSCLLVLILMVGCRKVDITTTTESGFEIPECVQAYIDSNHQEPTPNPWAGVWRWETGGHIYYYLLADCCDQFNLLYNERCEVVCAPDGGITGWGDGNCPTWATEPVKTLIWRDQ